MAYVKKRYHPPGTSPGTLTKEAPAAWAAPRIYLTEYDREHLEEKPDIAPQECPAYLALPTITWIHVQGLPEPAQLQELGALFRLHPLAMEDVLNTGQRPKIETYGEQYFVICSLPMLTDHALRMEQISLFFGPNYVVSVHDGAADPFEPVRKRLRDPAGRLRNNGADYLFYALFDAVIDQGFPALEALGDQLEDLEDILLDRPQKQTLHELHRLKRELITLRRMMWPQREVANTLVRDEHGLIRNETKLYLRDCYDHSVHILDMIENFRDITASMLDIYLSSVSYRLNEIMRVLTVIATIFIPPTFLVGLYGMNFDRSSPWNMPELGWKYGYVFSWGVILVMIGGMLYYFKRKRWF